MSEKKSAKKIRALRQGPAGPPQVVVEVEVPQDEDPWVEEAEAPQPRAEAGSAFDDVEHPDLEVGNLASSKSGSSVASLPPPTKKRRSGSRAALVVAAEAEKAWLGSRLSDLDRDASQFRHKMSQLELEMTDRFKNLRTRVDSWSEQLGAMAERVAQAERRAKEAVSVVEHWKGRQEKDWRILQSEVKKVQVLRRSLRDIIRDELGDAVADGTSALGSEPAQSDVDDDLEDDEEEVDEIDGDGGNTGGADASPRVSQVEESTSSGGMWYGESSTSKQRRGSAAPTPPRVDRTLFSPGLTTVVGSDSSLARGSGVIHSSTSGLLMAAPPPPAAITQNEMTAQGMRGPSVIQMLHWHRSYSGGGAVHWPTFLEGSLTEFIDEVWRRRYGQPSFSWARWSVEEFEEWMPKILEAAGLRAAARGLENRPGGLDFSAQLAALTGLEGYDGRDMNGIIAWIRKVKNLLKAFSISPEEFRESTKVDLQRALAAWKRAARENGFAVAMWDRVAALLEKYKEPLSYEKFLDWVYLDGDETMRMQQGWTRRSGADLVSDQDAVRSKRGDSSRKRPREDGGGSAAMSEGTRRTTPPCKFCGQRVHVTAECDRTDHPLANKLEVPWEQSESARLCARKGWNKIPPFAASKEQVEAMPDKPMRSNRGADGESAEKKKVLPASRSGSGPSASGKSVVVSSTVAAATAEMSSNDVLTTVVVVAASRVQKEVAALVDTGATGDNYISDELATWARQNGSAVCGCSQPKVVCSVFKGAHECVSCNHLIMLQIKFFKPQNNEVFQLWLKNVTSSVTHEEQPRIGDDDFVSIFLSFTVLPNSSEQLLIGLPTIRKYDLTLLCREQFVSPNILRAAEPELVTEEGTSGRAQPPPRPRKAEIPSDGLPEGFVSRFLSLQLRDQEHDFIKVIKDKKELLTSMDNPEEEDVFWRDEGLSLFPHTVELPKQGRGRDDLGASKKRTVEGDMVQTSRGVIPEIVGNLPVHDKARRIVEDFRDVFSTTVGATPASVPPMKIKLKEGHKWFHRDNKQPYRRLSYEKEQALRAQLEELVKLGVVSKAPAAYYSQVHMVKKPQKDPNAPVQWRLCIDYRNLNDATEGISYPIPNIKHLLDRIGQRKAKWFAVLDMTSGFHQVELHEDSRELAAFITPFGIFVPNRVPMGLKSAPSYFQFIMQDNVLVGIAFFSCELYIDDIIIFGDSEETFLASLRTVLEALRKYNVTLSPKKARIGLQEVEAVGHVLDQFGIRMSEEKIQRVMSFPLPKYGKQLKQFLGLANYFRDHVHRHSELARPLDLLVRNYKAVKNKLIPWDSASEEAFRSLQEAIGKGIKLYFLVDEGETILETDASDYGIGAFLYQLIWKKEEGGKGKKVVQPVAFLSQSLTPTERRWPTIAKECFAIYTALKNWEYMLGGRFFIIRTDHANLLHLNQNSPKIVNWKLAIQDFNFKVEYLKGEENVVADALSRITWDVDDHERALEDDVKARTRPERAEDVSMESAQTQVTIIARLSEIDEREARSRGYWQVANAIQEVRSSSGDRERLVTAIQESRPLQPAAHHPAVHTLPEWTEKLFEVHNSIVGHHGVERTLELLAKKGHAWDGMRRDVTLFIKNCPFCQKMRELKPLIHARHFTTATYNPFDRVNIDTVGPLPEDERGNQYILVFVDCFSRFVEVFPVKSTEAVHCADALISFVGRYGFPSMILTDRGPEFMNELIEAVTRTVGTRHIPTMQYSKEENSLVERRNKEVVRHLNAIVFDHRVRNRWSSVLPLAQRVLNAAPHSLLGVSPAQLIFGNTVNLDRGIFMPQSAIPLNPDEATPSVRQYLDKLLSAQRVIISIAQERQFAADVEHLRLSEEKEGEEGGQLTEFPINSYVVMRYPAGLGNGHRPPSKLHTKWQGPFRVVERTGDRYTLQNLVTNKQVTRHVAELALYRNDLQLGKPEEAAWRDDSQFEIDHIVSHKGHFTRLKSLSFRVRWKGYDASEDTFEPWSNLRTTVQLHDYLRKIGKESLIPRQFRAEAAGRQVT